MKERLAIGGAILATGIGGMAVGPEGAHADAPNREGNPRVEKLGSTVFFSNLSNKALENILEDKNPAEGTVFRIASNLTIICPQGSPTPPKKIVTISSPNGNTWRNIHVEDKEELRQTIIRTTEKVTTVAEGIDDTIIRITTSADRGEGNGATCGNHNPEKIIIPNNSIQAYVVAGKSANSRQETKGSDTTDNNPRAEKADDGEVDISEVLKWVIVGGVALAGVAAYKVLASRRQGH